MEIPTTEVILTQRCRLRYPTQEDLPHIWSASRVPGFNDGMVWDPPKNTEELTEPLRRSQKDWSIGNSYTWTIETKASAEFIGRIAIRLTDQEHVWSLGYWIHPSVQKTGFATEAAAAMLELGFSRLGAVRITAAHATWNEASGKVLQRIGLLRTGVNPRGFKKRGNWVEEYEYEIEADANR